MLQKIRIYLTRHTLFFTQLSELYCIMRGAWKRISCGSSISGGCMCRGCKEHLSLVCLASNLNNIVTSWNIMEVEISERNKNFKTHFYIQITTIALTCISCCRLGYQIIEEKPLHLPIVCICWIFIHHSLPSSRRRWSDILIYIYHSRGQGAFATSRG